MTFERCEPRPGGGPFAAAMALATSVAVALLLAANTPHAGAQPLVPSVFYGSASINGEPVPDGTPVRGYVDGKDCTQSADKNPGTHMDGGAAAYTIEVMHESQEPGCGAEGKTVTFTVGGQPVEQTAPWQFIVQRLDLNVGEGVAPPLPTLTPTPVNTAVPPEGQAATATAARAPTESLSPVPSGTPPTDPIQLPTTPRPPLGETPASDLPRDSTTDDDGGGPSVALLLVGALLVVGGVGAGAGYWLSRRTRGGDS